jgi:formiminotetrahydrofolate cyclodeaminase
MTWRYGSGLFVIPNLFRDLGLDHLSIIEVKPMDIKKFLERLSSAAPTPGGGSASALAGALSAALISMTAGLSLKKGELKPKEVREIRKKALRIQKRLFRAIEEDAKSYEAVLRAFHLPKDTEKERLVRSKAIQQAYREATITPQLVCQESIELLEYSNTLILKGNPNALSDVGVAAFLADTALKGGLLNIGINVGPVRDKSLRKKMRSLARRLEKRRDEIMRRIQRKLEESLII